MAHRQPSRRQLSVDTLVGAGVMGNWDPIGRQRGMFVLLGLSADQVARLRDEFGVGIGLPRTSHDCNSIGVRSKVNDLEGPSRRGFRKTGQRGNTATNRAITAITELISSGDFQLGDRLPTERALATYLGVSRSTVREAVRGLATLRIVDVRHGDGTFLLRLDGAALFESSGLMDRLTNHDNALDVLEVRRILESAAAELAAVRMTIEQRTELGSLLERVFASTTRDMALEADLSFHDFIAEAAGNQLLRYLIGIFSAHTYRARYLMTSVHEGERVASMKVSHALIYQAIMDRDPHASWVAASAHVQGVSDWYRSVLAQPDPPPERAELTRVAET